jgi:hypothetical protein
MPSRALQEWRTSQRAELDRLEAAVRASPRALRQQLVDAYILLLAGQFQLYCRRLHDEAVGIAAAHVRPAGAAVILDELGINRRLDRGNAHSAALRDDFRWLDAHLWTELARLDRRNELRRTHLDQLNVWRNAIAHQALPPAGPQAVTAAGTARTLRWARVWRANCSALAHQLDQFVKRRLNTMLGIRAW